LKDTLARRQESNRPLSNSLQIGTISRLVPQKNLTLLLCALKELSSVPDRHFELSIIGTGPMEDELHSICRVLGIDHQVSWLGQCQDVSIFYRSLDVFVLSSNYEGFGLVLLEAMSQGIPIVARKISAIPEVLGDQHPGLVESSLPHDFSRKIRELLDDKDLRRRCLEYQATRLEYFSIERTQAAHESLYSRLLQRRKL
jgi:glycosyltransferase involved in cell wall biosynthesis